MSHSSPTSEALFQKRLIQHKNLFDNLGGLVQNLEALTRAVDQSLASGGKLLLLGNGGSAADCQHIAAELVHRYLRDRRALAAIALTTNTSNLTSISNDSAYEQVFARQLEGLGEPGDVALGITTSGASINVLRGLETARRKGLVTAAFTGLGGAHLVSRVDHLILVPSDETPRIQEAHLFLAHMLCERLEAGMATKKTHVTAPDDSAVRRAFVHPSSYVDDGATIGDGTKIWYFCHVQSGATLGRDCILGQNVNVDRDVSIGNGVKIQNNVSVYKGVVIEDDVFLGPSMVLTNVMNPRSHVSRKNEFQETRVCKGASIGANATLICGHTIGRYAFVGAGAVVTRDVPPFALVVGNPARIKGWMCSCGVKLPLPADEAYPGEAVCSSCGRRYRKTGNALIELESK